MIARVITAMGGRHAHVVHGRTPLTAITAVGAATLVIFGGGHSSASPPLGVDVTGTGSSSLSMTGEALGGHLSPVTGTGDGVLTLSATATGAAIPSFTGTADATLSITGAAEGVNGASTGTGDGTLTLTASGAGSHVFPLTGTAAATLALTAAGVGAFYQPSVGAGASTLILTAAASGSLGSGSAPASITAPVVGTSRAEQWALQLAGATGPRNNYSNGTWNTTYAELPAGTGIHPQRPNDPYLRSLGFYYNNYGDLWVPFTWNSPGGSVTVADYNFQGAPTLSFWGNGSNVVITDCANFNANVGCDINRGPMGASYLMGLQIKYCDMNTTRWDLLCKTTFELGPYNRIRNQVQELGFGGGYLMTFYIGINCHHNYITGGGCNPDNSAHVEWWQHILSVSGTGSYAYVEDNMIDFSKDGQSNPALLAGWTGVISEGGDSRIKWNRNVSKGTDIVQKLGLHPPGGMGTLVAYGDGNVLAGFEFNDNAISYNPAFGPTYKHGGGSRKPSPTGNRWFRDADSDAVGCVGPADNTPLTIADFG